LVTIQELIEYLKKWYKPNEVVACDIWTTDDVFNRAKEIIQSMDKLKDATIGLTWATVDAFLDEILDEDEAEMSSM